MGSVKHPRPRDYGGRTADERVAQRRDALVRAAFTLVAEAGWRQLSVEVLCREAGLNKRYFYESFDGLDAVIAAVTVRLADDAITTTLAALGPGEAGEEATRRAIAAFVAYLTDDPRRARVLFGAVPAADAAAGHRAAAIRQVIASVSTHGRSIHVLDEQAVVETAAAMLVGGTSQAVLDWLDGRIACSRQDFIDDLAGLWQTLGAETASRARRRRDER